MKVQSRKIKVLFSVFDMILVTLGDIAGKFFSTVGRRLEDLCDKMF